MPTQITSNTLVQRTGREVALLGRSELVTGILRAESKGTTFKFDLFVKPRGKQQVKIRVGEKVAIKQLQALPLRGGGNRYRRMYHAYDFVG
jgi:hypothetical protein